MNIEFLNNNNINDFETALSEICKSAKTVLILSCDQNNYDIEKMNRILSNKSTPIIGGIFPQIVYQNKNYEKGTIIASLDDELDISIIKDLSKSNLQRLEDDIEEKFEELQSDIKTMFVFVDGLSKNINQLILALFENFGLTINYIGGGAGSLSFKQKPCIFSNLGLIEDCAILATSTLCSSIGVKHGWTQISNPIKVTKSEANIVYELDYKPALEVYKDIVEKRSQQKLDQDNFFDISKSHPLGINKLSGEMVVRDPIMMEGNSLVCVGDVAQNSFISILSGDNDSLINAVKQAKDEAVMDDKENFILFIDCISRVLFMDKNFQKELDTVKDDGTLILGALTLGEIANNKKHYLEFYNKTAVIARIEK